MLVSIQTLRCVVFLETIAFEISEQGRLNWYFVLANNQALTLADRFVGLIPRVRLDLFRCITLIRVRLENLIDQINALWRQSLWHLELATKNLLIELSRGFVFKRQVAGNHSKKNDTTGPYIDTGAVVLQSIDHLRCCVAGRATRRLEELSLLVSVTQAEVN